MNPISLVLSGAIGNKIGCSLDDIQKIEINNWEFRPVSLGNLALMANWQIWLM